MRIAIAPVLIAWFWCAPAVACTDGVDCFCDTLSGDANILWCDDFENPVYESDNEGWANVYNRDAVFQCWNAGVPLSSPNYITEGTEDKACLNIVQEGACDVAGQTDCVFYDDNALGVKFDTGWTHGVFGRGDFTATRDFGITSIVKLSSNYVRTNPGFKYWEFNAGKQSIHQGQDTCSSSANNTEVEPGQTFGVDSACGSQKIWDGKLFMCDQNPCEPLQPKTYTSTLGQMWDDGATIYFRPFESNFEGGSMDWPLDTWACNKTRVTNYGLSNMRIEQWFQGSTGTYEAKVFDMSNIDASNLGHENGAALTSVIPNGYYNGNQCSLLDCGYGTEEGCPCTNKAGPPARAYRYEDNWVIREGEPLTCAQIGFGAGATAVPGGTGLTITDGITLQ